MYSALAVLTPPAVEPLSLDLVRQHCRVDHSSDDLLLTRYQRAARTRAEQFLGRVLVTQTLRWVMAQVPPAGALPLLPMPLLVLPVILSFPQVWNRPLEIPRAPVQSVTAVTIVNTDGTTNSLVGGTDYTLDALIEPARITMCTVTYPTFVQHIEVDFVAGYDAAGATVPDDITMAILMLTAWMYENRGDTTSEPPSAFEALLWPYRVMFFGG